MSPRRSVEEHREVVRTLVGDALHREPVELPLALLPGRVLAADARTPVDLPRFRNSQMDGFAARAAELDGHPLPVAPVTIAAAPGAPAPLAPGTVARIMTGAPVPDGADCVVPVEHTTEEAGRVAVHVRRAVGDFVRERGSDAAAGDVLVPAGTRLASRHVAALAAAGLADAAVLAAPRVAVLTTGDELVEAGAPVGPGQLPDANGPALVAAVAEHGGEMVLAARTGDDPAAFRAVLDRAAASADLILTAGGISQGDFEVVRTVLEERGGADVTEIAMQPGGPQATATLPRRPGAGAHGLVPVVAFPGNPVSTQVSFAVFVRPLLRTAAGLPPIGTETRTLDDDVRSVAGKRQWLRGLRTAEGGVRVIAGPGSHLVAAMAAADVLIDVPEAAEALPAGTPVEVLPL